MDKKTKDYVIKELEKVDAALDRIGEGMNKISDIRREIKNVQDEFNLQMSYFQKRDIGRPFGMEFHDCEMTYQ